MSEMTVGIGAMAADVTKDLALFFAHLNRKTNSIPLCISTWIGIWRFLVQFKGYRFPTRSVCNLPLPPTGNFPSAHAYEIVQESKDFLFLRGCGIGNNRGWGWGISHRFPIKCLPELSFPTEHICACNSE